MGSSGASIELCSMPGCLCEMPFQHHTSTGTTSVRQVKKEIISALIQKTSTHKGGKSQAQSRNTQHFCTALLLACKAPAGPLLVPQPLWQYVVYKKEELREMAEPM